MVHNMVIMVIIMVLIRLFEKRDFKNRLDCNEFARITVNQRIVIREKVISNRVYAGSKIKRPHIMRVNYT